MAGSPWHFPRPARGLLLPACANQWLIACHRRLSSSPRPARAPMVPCPALGHLKASGAAIHGRPPTHRHRHMPRHSSADTVCACVCVRVHIGRSPPGWKVQPQVRLRGHPAGPFEDCKLRLQPPTTPSHPPRPGSPFPPAFPPSPPVPPTPSPSVCSRAASRKRKGGRRTGHGRHACER